MIRKMVLVPEAMLLELKGKLPKSPEFQATIGLGHQLDHIQGREDLNPEEKVALYGHQLHRYRNYLQQARDQGKERTFTTPLPRAEKDKVAVEDDGAAADVAADPSSSELEEQVIKSVSKQMQKRAGLLLDHLKKTKVLKWNSDGEISYRGKRIPQSNIVDLVTNTMRTKSRRAFRSPIGIDEFAQALKETNVPTDYLQNPNIIKAMQKPGKISTPKPLQDEKDDNDDDTGFQEAFTFTTPQASPFFMTPKVSKTVKKRGNAQILNWDKLGKK